MKFSSQQARDAFNKLSEKVQTYITSDAVTEATNKIAAAFQLQGDARAKFGYAIGTILLKLVATEKLAEMLKTELAVPSEKVAAIAEQVQREILAKVPKEGTPVSVPVVLKPIVPVAPSLAAPAPSLNASHTTPPSAPLLNQGGELKGRLTPPTDEKNLRALFRISVGTTYTEDALRKKFESLPVGLRQAIASVDTANAVQTIAKRYILHIDQMGALSSETGLVLLGLTHPRDFTKNLAVRLRISEPRALEIAKSVSEAVLVKVKETLRGLHDVKPPEKRTQPIEPPRKLNVLSEQAETPQTARLPTPAGVANGGQAKWNTGEEKPEREEILRGVENPRAAVGPTGWRPATQNAPTPLPPPKPVVPPPPPSPPLPPKTKSVLDEKLSQTVSFPREEKKYSVDPYREPIQ